ncbi:MAG: phosphoglucomutase [Planctomycetota bacterium]|nr:MAG: phosphoglucomutase [Planctomycetota bacterium]
MNPTIKATIETWLSQCPFDHLKQEIIDLQNDNNEKELVDRFYKEIEFGTGGMRAVMAAGLNRINEEVVGKTTQGLANYILSQGGDEYAKRGLAIAHDSRLNHKIYLQEIASVLAGNNIKVYFFDRVRPTPLLSYALRKLKAVSGIVITASHNTSEYNGYKVYWDDGGQIVPPHDKNIIDEVRKVKSYNDVKRMDFLEGIENGLIQTISDDIVESYYNELEDLIINKDVIRKHGDQLKIIYTPLHGASGETVMGMFKKLGFSQAQEVKSQFQPDGSFPTVASPNPEERSALKLALEQAQKEDADLLFANDPDGDRMAVGAKNSNGEWELLNGNQVGSIMAWYILDQLKQQNKLPSNGALIKTIVTTELQSEIAKKYQVTIFNTLTGFKFIGALIRKFELEAEQNKDTYQYIFGGEESYGYLPHPIVRDKDGVMALGLAAEIAAYAKETNKTLVDLLNDIYCEFGLFQEDLISITLKGKDGIEKMNEIMNALRNSPPLAFDNANVIEIKDYQESVVKNIEGKTTGTIDLAKSNVLEFNLEDSTRITARPSGTEPKIKFYFSVRSKTSPESLSEDIQTLKDKLVRLKSEFEKTVESI